MPDAGRTAHAPRVATTVRPAAAALLLPLLAAAFLTALWFLGGTPAHALDLHGGMDGSESDTLDPSPDADAGTTDGDGTSDTGSASDNDPATDRPTADDTTEARTTGSSLDTLVPGEVTAPVTDTLGSVHQHLEDPASEPDGGGLSESGLPVAEVGEGARRVVEGLGREDGGDPGTGLTSVLTGEGTLTSEAASENSSETAARDRGPGDDRATERDRRTSEDTAPDGPGTVPRAAADTTPVFDDTTDHHAEAAPESGAHSDVGEPRRSHLASAPTSSAQTAGSAAPAVAGYLPSSPVAGPASTTVRPWSIAPHGVPSDPADDPMVSPD